MPWKKLWAATILYVTIIVAIFWRAKVQYVVHFFFVALERSGFEPRAAAASCTTNLATRLSYFVASHLICTVFSDKM